LTYAAGVLAIGWYYSRKNRSAEDYMLGARRMKPWTVGLSLFATLTSAVSYLVIPGEIIKHGPMLFSSVLIYPFIFLVVGWLLIPRILKFNIQSAYELLEIRFGLSVRMLSSMIFLMLRLLWMAFIIHLTAQKVIIPVMNWPPESALWVSILIGVITIIYSAMGGLRAVIVTDVMQTIILLGGAVAALITINLDLGGVAHWMPKSWEPHWAEPKFGLDSSARVTLAASCISYFTWYICTAGSDQMAVQRYLSTKDIKQARRSVAFTLLTDFIVLAFLIMLGLALLAYFRHHTHLLPGGTSPSDHADSLFPRFIMIGLPSGIRGLIISGLLAAAMSSLSSGLNSACLVVSRDFVARFRKTPAGESSQVRWAMVISFGIGAVVIILSLLFSKVKGNLVEVSYKTVNLLAGPLFVPFFMAFFVRRASTLGTFIGVLVSIATAVLMAFWPEEIGLKNMSFLWLVPGAFFMGVMTSYIVSFFCSGK
jgi:SSS family solute:Na+ symporter